MATYRRTRFWEGDTQAVNWLFRYYAKAGWQSEFAIYTELCDLQRYFADNPSEVKLRSGQRAAPTACYDVGSKWLPSQTRLPDVYDNEGHSVIASDGVPLPRAAHAQVNNDFYALVGPPRGDILERMLTRLLTQVPADLDFGNFLLESRESVELIPSLLGSWTDFLRQRPPGDSWRRALREGELGVPQSTASGHLWWQFGVAPLLSDLNALANLGESVSRKLEKLRRVNGRVTTRRVGPWGPDILPAWRPWRSLETGYIHNWNFQWEYRLESLESVYRSQCYLDCRLDGLDDWTGWPAVAIASLGLNNPMAIAYEAIPFSFVLDYAIPLGDRLRRVGSTPISGVWNISDIMWSCAQRATYAIRLRHYLGDGAYAVTEMGKVECHRFYRDTEFPGFPFSWPLSAGQALNLLSLFLAS